MEQKGNKWVCHDKFTVAEITYNANREITGLVLMNQDGREVYRLRDKSGSRSTAEQADGTDAGTGNTSYSKSRKSEFVNADEKQAPDKVQMINRELERTGIALDMVLGRYGVSSIETMDDDTYRRALNSLKRTKGKAA